MTEIEGIKQKSISYLTFKIGDEVFASHVAHVNNILEVTRITKVPKTPDYMKGVINLRGSVLPLIDTRIKFGMPPTEFTSNTCILVLDIQVQKDLVKLGILVDSVQEVIEIDEKDILPPPNIGMNINTDFINGMFKMEDEFIMILNMDLIFSTEDLANLKQIYDSVKNTMDVSEMEEAEESPKASTTRKKKEIV